MNVKVSVTQIKSAFSQIADKPSRKTISRAGRIENILQQVARDHEQGILTYQHGPILAALDDQRIRPQVKNLRRRFPQVVFVRQHTGLAVIDEQKIPILDGLEQLLASLRNPKVHGVAADKANVLHLPLHIQLQRRLNISEEKIRLFRIGRRKLR